MNMWAGLVGADTKIVDQRFKALEELLRTHGKMDSREAAKRLDWSVDKVKDVVNKSPRLRACGSVEIMTKSLRNRPVIGLMENWHAGLNRPQKSKPKLATRMAEMIVGKGPATYPEMSSHLNVAVGLLKDLVSLRPDVFQVVGYREIESPRRIKTPVYEYFESPF